MRLKDHAGSVYLDASSRPLARRNSRAPRFMLMLSVLLALSFMATAVNFGLASTQNSRVAFAAGEDEDPELGFQDATEGQDSSQKGFDKILRDFEDPTIESQTKSLKYAIFRQFTVRYLNAAPKAVIPGDRTDPRNGVYNCNAKDAQAGTLMYHNCDVPNLMTEFLQDAGELVLPSGPVGAERETAYMGSSRWGLPSATPSKVSLDTGIKYTGLELYGYNLKYTSYAGEWDHVKVMTAARALTNFGLMDQLKLGVASIINGITAGLDVAVDGLIDDLTSGSIVSIVTAPFHSITNFFKGATAAGINTIMDTSDTNIFSTNAWYRPEFGSTIYGARELSEAEIAAVLQQTLLDAITKSLPRNARPPTELRAMENPPRPTPAVCSAVYTNTESKNTFTRNNPDPAGVSTRLLCQTWANQYVSETVKVTTLNYAAAETLPAWQARTWGPVAESFNIACSLPTTGTRESQIESFYACWPAQWRTAIQEELKNAQKDLNTNWLDEGTSVANIRKAMSGSKNFNDPRSRYICTSKTTGKDLGNGNYVYLFTGDGKLNPRCQLPVRAPIQDGLFGNGYADSQTQPVVDPRREQFQPTLMSVLFGPNALTATISDFGLNVSNFTTRVSNTVLNLSMSPVLDTLGIDTIVTELVKGFRDGIFYPLVLIAVAIGGVAIFVSALRRRDYTRQIANAGLLCLTFIIGVIFMEKPAQIIRIVDEVPAAVESVVVGAIFETGNSKSDNVCKAASTTPNPGRGIEGEQLSFDPSASTRVLMCENWRTFLFTPYVYGQWGTAYDTLDASAMNNTNNELVGNARVNMGRADQTERNWALYQLDAISTGTTTQQDSASPSGSIDPNFYKIVDMQAHPDLNGVGKADSSYYSMWNGDQGGSRAFISVMGAVLSILGMSVVIIYAFAKIQVSLLVTLMLLFMPFMFLIGMHPTAGRQKLKGYFAQIGAMMIQRVLLVTMIALMMRLIVAMASATENFYLFFILALAICLAFLSYRKEIIGMFSRGITDKFGSFGGGKLDDAGDATRSVIPNSLESYAYMQRSRFGGAAAGAVGGYMVGGMAGARTGAQMNATREGNKAGRFLARRGQGALYSAGQGANAAKENVTSDLTRRAQPLKEELSGKLLDNKFTEDGSPARASEEVARREVLGEFTQPKTRKEILELDQALDAREARERLIQSADNRSDRAVQKEIQNSGRGQDASDLSRVIREEAIRRDFKNDSYKETDDDIKHDDAMLVRSFDTKARAVFERLEAERMKKETDRDLRASAADLTDRLLGDSTEDDEGKR